MAFNANSYFSNSIQGIPQVGADFNIFDMHSSPRYALGTRIRRQDGNEYVYTHFGADTAQARLASVDLSATNVAEAANSIIAPASAQTTTDGTLGSKFVEITDASITADQFAGGYFVTSNDVGEGYTYRIKGNTATGTPASGNIRLELYEKLQVAVDATTDYVIAGSRYSDLKIAAAGDDLVSGVTVSNIVFATAPYAWICVKGITACLIDGTINNGDVVALSDGVDGAVHQVGGGDTSVGDIVAEPIIGYCVVTAASAGEGAIFVNL